MRIIQKKKKTENEYANPIKSWINKGWVIKFFF